MSIELILTKLSQEPMFVDKSTRDYIDAMTRRVGQGYALGAADETLVRRLWAERGA